VRKRLLGTVAVAACVIGVPAGFALGQAIDQELAPPQGPYKAAAACPEAAALFKANGLKPDFFIPACPGPETLAEMEESLEPHMPFVKICRDEAAAGSPSEACRRLLEVQAIRRAAQ
jgi:hypothetical protein